MSETQEALDTKLPEPAPAPRYEYEIAGKAVAFRRRLPLPDGAKLLKLTNQVKGDQLESNIPVLQLLIESWGFAGSPQDAASYQALDTFDEFLPLITAAGEHVQARLGKLGDAKN